MKLTPVMEKFIVHWGEMGTKWGINRTVAQIHALLYISPRPLHAEEIADTLGVARSNVSTSLKELQGWGIVRSVPILGERKEHFETLKSVWDMFQIILDERKKREIDPTVTLLRQCVADAERSGKREDHTKERLSELLAFFETATGWYEQIRRLPQTALIKFVRMGDKVREFVG